MAPVDFGVLGPLTVCQDDVPLSLGTPKGQAVLAVLLCRLGRPVTAEALADAIWGEEQPKSAAKNVQTYVHRLRQVLAAPGRITWEGHGYLLRAGRDELDAARFEDLAGQARSAVVAGELEEARRLFGGALSLWRGPAFAGIADISALAVEATRLDELRLRVLEERIDVDLRLGGHGELLGELTALTTEHPFRERMWAQLMLALYRGGRRADALAAYLQARDVLAEEAGLDPGLQLRELHQAILREDPALDAQSHDVNVAKPRMLPPALGDFTGQQGELAQIEAVLRKDRAGDGPAAVVTISGPGGIGKTALAVQAAHRLKAEYTDGQLFATLAGTRAQPVDPGIVLGRFLRALGVPATAVPDDPEERVGLYRSLLAERRILVTLDDALDETQLAPLMPAGGTCGVLITGRVRLAGLGGARRVELGEMSETDSLALLRRSADDRLASAPQAELSSLVRLCARLPLALRIAGSLLASRPHWHLADLVSRMDDEQHRLDALRYRDLEVRASFGLSYEGLRPEARRLFRLLGLLEAPDFPLWAAAAVLDTEPHAAQRLLDDLVDVHLLDVTGTPNGQARYGFHDLIRAYARERAEDEESARDRESAVVRALGALLALTDIADRDHMAQNMFQQDAARWRPEQVVATLPPIPPTTALNAERVALMAGVRQAAELGRQELCAELAVGGRALFETQRYFDDWQECYRTAMTLAKTAGNLRSQARLLISVARLRHLRRWYGPAEESSTEAMCLFERIGDRRGYLEALGNAPFFLVPNGRLTEAIEAGSEAYERLNAGGQAAAALHAYSQVGLAHLQAGRPAVAAEVLAEIVAGARQQGIRTLIARDTYWLGQARLALGEYADAEKAFDELSASAADIGPSGGFYATHARGCLHLAWGEHAEARRWLLDGVEIARALNDPMFETRVLIDLLETGLRDRQDIEASIKLGEPAAEVARGINYPYLLAGVLDRLARLHTMAGDDGTADRLSREANTTRARIR